MKKQFLTLVVMLFAVVTMAQTPATFNYQAVARDGNGKLIQNKEVSLRISILKTTATGASQFVETHKVMTNQYGLVNLAIGGGTKVSGDFGAINWAADKYFIKVDMDATGGSAFTDMGTQQLLSVPYALQAKSVENSDNSNTNEIQTLSRTGTNVALSKNGRSVSIADNDNSVTNEMQSLTLSGNNLGITGKNTLSLSKYLDSKWTGSTTIYTLATTVGIGSSTPLSNSGFSIYPKENEYGIFMNYDHTHPGNTHGLYIDLDNTYTGAASTYGVYVDTRKDNGSGSVYGTRSYARNYTSSSSPTYGVYAYGFKDKTGGTNYALYAYESGSASIEYAGYFSGRGYSTISFTSSDMRLKKNVEGLNSALTNLMKIDVKLYDFKTKEFAHMNLPEGRHAGIMAQDLEKLYPELVATAVQPKLSDVEKKDMIASGQAVPARANKPFEFKAVSYAGLVPHLIKGMQEQQAMIVELKKQVAELQAAVKIQNQ